MYKRPQMKGRCLSDSCGKLIHVITPYLDRYLFARDRIFLRKDGNGHCLITVKNSFIEFMPDIVSARFPPLRAAKTNIQLEFARVVESIRRSDDYRGKSLLYIAGLNIDISENEELPVMNYFVPWAAHVQLKDGTPAQYTHPIEQDELFAKLMVQSPENPDQIDLKENIRRILKSPRLDIRSSK